MRPYRRGEESQCTCVSYTVLPGVPLEDAHALVPTKLLQDESLKSWAIDWSPDGTKLLVTSVEAQGRCRYSVITVASGEAAPVEGINGCGANGTIVGFATLP